MASNTIIQLTRTSVSGRAANTTTLPNPGQIGMNMTDGIVYGSNGSVVFTVGANLVNQSISNSVSVAGINTTNSSGIYTSGALQVTGLVTTQSGIKFPDGNTQMAAGYTGFRNRIINGDMRIDQRNVGAAQNSLAAVNTYLADRCGYYTNIAGKFNGQQNAGSIVPPVGFSNYIGLTSTSNYTVAAGDYGYLSQVIEGYNISDLAWGTSSAKSVTLSFWAYSSLTGQFTARLVMGGSGNYLYLAPYTISQANTWTYITITVPGCTSGTWNINNTAGLYVEFVIIAGSSLQTTTNSQWSTVTNSGVISGSVSIASVSGATFYLTGVQLEKGSVATPFEFRMYGTELALCQRYFETSYDSSNIPGSVTNNGMSNVTWTMPTNAVYAASSSVKFAVTKRVDPTITMYSPITGVSSKVRDNINNTDINPLVQYMGTTGFTWSATLSSTSIYVYMSGHWTANSEL